ncbi:MAG: hypothetical protein ACRDG3_05255 [Tepidiformaceae bacterium]
MHSYYFMAEMSQEEFVQARLASAAHYHSGTGSPIVRMIGGAAAGLRRGSSAIERWASGPIESAGRQSHATIR